MAAPPTWWQTGPVLLTDGLGGRRAWQTGVREFGGAGERRVYRLEGEGIRSRQV